MTGTTAKTPPFQPLENRRVVLGVTGGIAAYKAVDLASKLTQQGALVDVILTEGATRLVTAVTFAALTHRPVFKDMFEAPTELHVGHIDLATRAEAMLIAPATANTIAKLALGISDNLLTATALATTAPLIVAPAMNVKMYGHPATQENLRRLEARGVHIVGPASGRLATGISGPGRMEEPETIVGHVRLVLGKSGDLAGRRIVVSAGGTHEPLDPVRLLVNRSSGKMGYALAEAARDRGADVTLVAAPTALPDPVGISVVHVETALDMRSAVVGAAREADLLLMAAAVADFRPSSPGDTKMKRAGKSTLTLELEQNPDIVAEASGERLVKVAFAAETGDAADKAREKLAAKGAALIVANDVSEPGSGFGTDTNRVTILGADGTREDLPLMDKLAVAHHVLDRALPLLYPA